MNLLQNKDDWNPCFDWGSTSSPFLVSFQEDMVIWNNDGSVYFNVGYSPSVRYQGWYRDNNWNKVTAFTPYGAGMIVSKNQYGFGTYEMIFRLPNFRGSWPAFWLIDVLDNKTQGGMGIPPEIDVFEHFRKDSCLTRHHITTTYHGGPTYENDWMKQKAKYSLCPVDKDDMKATLIWNSESFTVNINDKKVLQIDKNSSQGFPYKSMNVVVNSGIGDWQPDVKSFSPFIVKSLVYTPE